MSSYRDVCERLYSDWLAGRETFTSSFAEDVFSPVHAPEPYLIFGAERDAAIWVTTNPGQGFDFQHRPSVASESIFKGVDTYDAAARKLGSFYAHPTAPIHAAARANIAAMLRISQLFGRTSAMQVETYPWHSAKLPDKARLDAALVRKEPRFTEYRTALNKLLATEPLVLAWCAGVPTRRSGAGMDLKAQMIGLDLARAQMTALEVTNAISQALFWSNEGGRFRGLFVTQGSATLPSGGINRRGEWKDELIAAVSPT